ncbi:uncharacterized protein LOC130743972 [Lotus japonicus]|uniref:uncharacterized protein LOC130743972 n=1 Tax=Lotus japonicus TaxID=34305 RepID=UPI002584BDD2|nr:uncharacterized protein LOC130743972 [Lotus japonicus]
MSHTAGINSPLKSLCGGRDTWRIKVRVIRVWEMSPVSQPSKPYAMSLVLVDSDGMRIEAVIRKGMIQKFKRLIVEGQVYKIVYFNVVENDGAYRASPHEFKIVFNGRTKVERDQSDIIPLNSFYFKNSEEISATLGESDVLVDMIGLVTAISIEKQYVKGGNVNKIIVLELTDDRGKVHCSFFGRYVDIVRQFAAVGGHGMPVAIIQFAKVKTFKGDVVLQNVMNATKLMWNPDVPEANSFRDGLALHDIDVDLPIGQIDDGFRRLPTDQDSVSLFPRKSIGELHSTGEEGRFTVMAEIVGLTDGEKWWYTSCHCHRSVTAEDGLYFCSACCVHVFEVTPRFRVKFEVSDGEDLATFVLFDADCQI